MKRFPQDISLACLGLMTMAGCATNHPLAVQPPLPPGTHLDEVLMLQENNAESAKFIVYMHEFQLNGSMPDGRPQDWRLNEYGEDHLMQIAFSLRQGASFPVVVERSHTSVRPESEHKYPVHFNEELDQRRRMIVVASLEAMGVADAEQRVLVAPSFAEGFTGMEATQAYDRGFNSGGAGNGSGNGGGGIGIGRGLGGDASGGGLGTGTNFSGSGSSGNTL